MEDNIDDLVSDRKKFDNFVYTSLDQAIKELKKRQTLKDLDKKLEDILNNDIPQQYLDFPRATILRNINTPNYELRRFINIVDTIEELKPLIVEYPNDKFVPSNVLKKMLCKLGFFRGMTKNKRSGPIIDRITIADIDECHGKKMSDIKTIWGQSLVDFHHEFFDKTYRKLNKDYFYDISDWYYRQGPEAKIFYKAIFALFIKHGILFENFMIDDKEEGEFAKKVMLPAFFEVCNTTGLKPLIVALEPTDIEGDKFWLCYPIDDKAFVENKMFQMSINSKIEA